MDLLEASGDSAIKDLLWNSPGSTVLDESIRLHRICQTLNLWASVLPKPKSLGHALDEMSYRTAEDSAGMALSAYLLNEGIEACSNAASLARHWVTITQTFPAEQVMPYLPKMPAQAKGKFLESELGL
jgi:hypothetical protein